MSKLKSLIALPFLSVISGCYSVLQFYDGDPRPDSEVATIYLQNFDLKTKEAGCWIDSLSGRLYGPYKQIKVLPGTYKAGISLKASGLTSVSPELNSSSRLFRTLDAKAGRSYTCTAYFNDLAYETEKPPWGIGFSHEKLISGTWNVNIHEYDPPSKDSKKR